jgi:serine/threonine protein kinase
MKPGEQFGNWTLVGDKPLGEGGNSVVWRVTGPTHEAAAIKFLTRFDRYKRFRDEVRFQQEHSQHAGILPLLDAYLPDLPSKGNRPWLVTPIALGLSQYVEGTEDKLSAAVRSVRDVAFTLVDVHAQGAAHRDIKPDNLFVVDGHAVIGDFGLVSYIGKDPITTAGERLGPIHYVAPELIGNTDELVEYRPGDVYSLAKTLWVLASGQRYPLPGNLSANEPAAQLCSYVSNTRAVLLDRLLDTATLLNPNRRPTASKFAEELEAWLADKKPAFSVPQIPAPTSARLRQLATAADEAQRHRELATGELQRLLTVLHVALLSLGEQIAQSAGLNSRSTRLPDGNTNASLKHFPYRISGGCLDAGNRCFEEYFQTVRGQTIVVGGYAVLEALPSGTGLLQGGLALSANHRSAEVILRKEVEFGLATAVQEGHIKQFLSDIQAGVPALADRLAEILVEESRSEP